MAAPQRTKIEITYRLAQLEDVDQLVEMINQTYKGGGWTYEGQFMVGSRVEKSYLEDVISKQPNECALILGIYNSQIIGCIRLQKQEKSVLLGLLTVDANYQSQGVGRRLVEYAWKYQQEQWKSSISQIFVVNLRNELLEWYQKLGYEFDNQKRELTNLRPEYSSSYLVGLQKQL